MRLLPLLLLAGCASPGTYSQAAPAPFPAPPMAPAGRGAPVVGQPSQRPQEIPRSPHARPLPPSREPGLWGVEPPRGTASTGQPSLLGQPLPYPPGVTTEVEKRPALMCARSMSEAIARLSMADQLPPIPEPSMRPCAAAVLYFHCMEERSKIIRQAKALGIGYDAVEYKAYEATLKAAREFLHAQCGPSPFVPPSHRFTDVVIMEWERRP